MAEMSTKCSQLAQDIGFPVRYLFASMMRLTLWTTDRCIFGGSVGCVVGRCRLTADASAARGVQWGDIDWTRLLGGFVIMRMQFVGRPIAIRKCHL
jgi:hypothetical protein